MLYFRLHLDLSGQSYRHDRPATYNFNEHGHLVLHTEEGTRRTYHQWAYVEEFDEEEEMKPQGRS